jgi:hypothetical protein
MTTSMQGRKTRDVVAPRQSALNYIAIVFGGVEFVDWYANALIVKILKKKVAPLVLERKSSKTF